MTNSKGGFLVEDGKEVDEQMRAKEMQRERERVRQNFQPRELSAVAHRALF
jgi:DNA-repair protein complementing XP-A cells